VPRTVAAAQEHPFARLGQSAAVTGPEVEVRHQVLDVESPPVAKLLKHTAHIIAPGMIELGVGFEQDVQPACQMNGQAQHTLEDLHLVPFQVHPHQIHGRFVGEVGREGQRCDDTGARHTAPVTPAPRHIGTDRRVMEAVPIPAFGEQQRLFPVPGANGDGGGVDLCGQPVESEVALQQGEVVRERFHSQHRGTLADQAGHHDRVIADVGAQVEYRHARPDLALEDEALLRLPFAAKQQLSANARVLAIQQETVVEDPPGKKAPAENVPLYGQCAQIREPTAQLANDLPGGPPRASHGREGWGCRYGLAPPDRVRVW
jgi:hypothetical protein